MQHVHAPDEGWSILGLRQQQDLLDPLQQQLADGCHLTRETGRLISDSAEGPPSRWEGRNAYSSCALLCALRVPTCVGFVELVRARSAMGSVDVEVKPSEVCLNSRDLTRVSKYLLRSSSRNFFVHVPEAMNERPETEKSKEKEESSTPYPSPSPIAVYLSEPNRSLLVFLVGQRGREDQYPNADRHPFSPTARLHRLFPHGGQSIVLADREA